ncbi:MAG: hypothetical protein AAGA56_10830, partial [Myxococcota bacterium]
MTELPRPMEGYLRELETNLSSLDADEREEILQELRGIERREVRLELAKVAFHGSWELGHHVPPRSS